ncbi:MAG: DPP IV N-terminal domain-containing protein [Dehalococcoidia bacterium]|nr:DPP IV N-terminal domain-containing protein [Dehalococcoidia bacterium]
MKTLIVLLALAVVALVSACGGGPQGPQGRIAFVSGRSGNHEIWVMNADGSNPHQVTHIPPLNFDPSWSPDGGQIVFISTAGRNENTNIYIMNADGSNLRQVTDTPDTERAPRFLPDGKSLAFAKGLEAFLIDLDGSNERPWGTGLPGGTSPDGEKAAFTVGGTGWHVQAGEVWVANIDGGDRRRLTETMAYTAAPSWSPDGDRIAMECAEKALIYQPFIEPEPDTVGICLIDQDGSGLRRVTDNASNPTWSPDGSWIAFWRDEDIYVMRADGTGARKITDYPGQDRTPAWGPVLEP